MTNTKHKHKYVLLQEGNAMEMLCECGVNIRSILKGISKVDEVPLHDYEVVHEDAEEAGTE